MTSDQEAMTMRANQVHFHQLSTKMTFLVDALTLSPSAFVKPWIKSLSLNKAFLTNRN